VTHKSVAASIQSMRNLAASGLQSSLRRPLLLIRMALLECWMVMAISSNTKWWIDGSGNVAEFQTVVAICWLAEKWQDGNLAVVDSVWQCQMELVCWRGISVMTFWQRAIAVLNYAGDGSRVSRELIVLPVRICVRTLPINSYTHRSAHCTSYQLPYLATVPSYRTNYRAPYQLPCSVPVTDPRE
jgi:hypothetical protein